MNVRPDFPGIPRATRDGFTLVELMVASAITLLIAGLIVGVVSNSLVSWNRAHGTLTAESQGYAVLDRLTQDLQGAIFRDDGRTWLVATVQAGAGVSGSWVGGTKPAATSLNPAPPQLADARFGEAGVWLRLITTAQGTELRPGDPSAPVAAAYQIIRRPPTPSGGLGHYVLYRSEVTPSGTLAAGYDLSAPIYLIGSDADGSAGSLVRPGIHQAIADNVIDFGVRFYVRVPDPGTGGLGLVRVFPIDAANLEHMACLPPTAGDLRSRFPAVADVMLRVLTDEGARQIAALETGQITGEWWDIASANSRVLTRRVVIPAGSP